MKAIKLSITRTKHAHLVAERFFKLGAPCIGLVALVRAIYRLYTLCLCTYLLKNDLYEFMQAMAQWHIESGYYMIKYG